MAERGDDDSDLGERRSSAEPDQALSPAGEGGAVPEVTVTDRPVLGSEDRHPGSESTAAPRSPGEDPGLAGSAAPLPEAENVPEAAPDRSALGRDEGADRDPGPQSTEAPGSPREDPGSEGSAAPVPEAENVPEAALDRPALGRDEGADRDPNPQSTEAPGSPREDPGSEGSAAPVPESENVPEGIMDRLVFDSEEGADRDPSPESTEAPWSPEGDPGSVGSAAPVPGAENVPEAITDRLVLDRDEGATWHPSPESTEAPRSPEGDPGSEGSAASVAGAENVPEAITDRLVLDRDEGATWHPSPESTAAPRSPEGDPGSECPGCQAPGAPELPCGHRLCAACVQLSRQEGAGGDEMGDGGCSICYGARLMDSVLRSLLGVLFQGQPRRPTAGEGDAAAGDGVEEGRCSRHGQPFTVFCLEEEEPLCEECVDDEHDDDHHCCPLQEAATACKRELQFSLRSLREQLETLTSARDACQDSAAYIKSQFEGTSLVLREEFEKMHQFLRDREVAAMTSLREEEEEKSRRISEKMEKIEDGMEGLTDAVAQTEEAVALESHVFLKNYKRASERAGYRTADPEEESGSLLDVAQHQGCLHYHVWEKMLDTFEYVPVTLDPNTASPWLSVSADLASVRAHEEPQTPAPPANRERFLRPGAVLGSEGFQAGRHGWEVEVGDNARWSLGVARENIGRRKDPRSGPGPGPGPGGEPDGDLWVVSLADGQYRAFPGRGDGPIRLRRRPRRVRVLLDWERGCLTLSDAADNGLIHRFKQRWGGPLRPYLSTTCTKHPLRIMARKVTVSAE